VGDAASDPYRAASNWETMAEAHGDKIQVKSDADADAEDVNNGE
jgi:hypothetical protein